MKKILLTLFIGLSAIVAFGQEHSDKVNQRYFEAKIREFVYRLNLTDQQRDAFIPIYKRYNEEIRTAVGERETPQSHPATPDEAATLAKARIERQQMAQTIRMKYVDEFAAVLTPDQMDRLYQVESQIQRKLLSRKNGHRHGHKRQSGNKNR